MITLLVSEHNIKLDTEELNCLYHLMVVGTRHIEDLPNGINDFISDVRQALIKEGCKV